MSEKRWITYEEVTKQLLYDVKEYLGLGKIEGKQKVKGNISRTEWEVDVVAYDVTGEKIILVECKQRSNFALSQESLAGFAYRIMDTNAERGIIVTTIGLQEGAEKIASASNITAIKLDYNSTSEDYIARITDKIFVKRTEKIGLSNSGIAKKFDKNGNLVDQRNF